MLFRDAAAGRRGSAWSIRAVKMSLAEFYLDQGIDPGDPYHMDAWLAGQRESLAGFDVDEIERYGGAPKTIQCPACSKVFKKDEHMQEHLKSKKDADHTSYRAGSGRNGFRNPTHV